jgi:hypothetical protein
MSRPQRTQREREPARKSGVWLLSSQRQPSAWKTWLKGCCEESIDQITKVQGQPGKEAGKAPHRATTGKKRS